VTASLWAVSHFVKFFCHKLEIATKRPNFLRIQIEALGWHRWLLYCRISGWSDLLLWAWIPQLEGI